MLKKGDVVGDWLVVEYHNAMQVEVRSISNGYMTTCVADALRKGRVKNRLKPSVCGIGYLGLGHVDTKSISYTTWSTMLSKGRPVCARWLNYSLFQEDLPKLTNYHHWLLAGGYRFFVLEGKEYNITNCSFIPEKESMKLGPKKRKLNNERTSI